MSGVPFGRAQGQRAAQLMELLGLSEEELCQILDVDEGFHARVPEIAQVAHRFGALLHVDSAWGPLAGFH